MTLHIGIFENKYSVFLHLSCLSSSLNCEQHSEFVAALIMLYSSSLLEQSVPFKEINVKQRRQASIEAIVRSNTCLCPEI